MIGTIDQTRMDETHASTKGRWVAVVVIALATLLGGGVRLAQLGGGGAWFDELYTIRDVSTENTGYGFMRWLGYQPTKLGLQFQGIAADEIPGARYWEYRASGVTMGKARLAACLIGVLMIPLLAWGAWRPLGPGAAAVLAVLIAVSVWNISWSQTARFYTQVGLFGGLAVLLYIDAIKTGSRWRFAGSTICVVLAFLTHPPAVLIGGAFVLDALVQLARRRPLNYGAWGWSWGTGTMLLCGGLVYLESQRFDAFVGSEGGGGAAVAQSVPDQSLPMIFVYVVIMLTPVLVAAAAMGLLFERRNRTAWVLGFAAVAPVIGIAALSVLGQSVHGRYSYVSMIGWLGLAAVGLSAIHLPLRQRFGKVLAWSPVALVVVAMLPTLGSYLTTGHRFIEPFHVAWRAVGGQIAPDDAVFAERIEIAQYELGREDVMPLPGVLDAMDSRAEGRDAWVVRLSANSRGRRPWKPAESPRMQLIFRDAGAVWLPRREVSVYQLTPPNVPIQGVGSQP